MSETTTDIVIKAPSEAEGAEAKESTSAVVANAKALKIKTREDLTTVATEALTQVATKRKAFEKQRVEMKAPSLEAGKRVDNFWKPFISELEEAERIIKSSMTTAKSKFDKEDAEREAKIMARAEKEGRGRITEDTAISQISNIDRVDRTVRTESGSATFKKIKQVTVTDEALIPRKYLVVDMAALRRDAIQLFELQAGGHTVEQIPGVEVKETETVATR